MQTMRYMRNGQLETGLIVTSTADAITMEVGEKVIGVPRDRIVFNRRTGVCVSLEHTYIPKPLLVQLERGLLLAALRDAESHERYRRNQIAECESAIIYWQNRQTNLKKRIEALPEDVPDTPPKHRTSTASGANLLASMGYDETEK